MRVQGSNYRSVWLEGPVLPEGRVRLRMIDQTLLPHDFVVLDISSVSELAAAISDMKVRGAPAIGASGAYGMVLAAFDASEDLFFEELREAKELLSSTRPTARDLFTALDALFSLAGELLERGEGVEYCRAALLKGAQSYVEKSLAACREIGRLGAHLIRDGASIMTHCNAGWLACVDWGTALSPMYFARNEGRDFFVYVDETRPRCQGARLTSWELLEEGIRHAVIADNASAYYMQKGVSLVIVGADRITLNGDVANKIGTFEKAVLAKELGVPFYVAAPLSTFDFSLEDGSLIPIEERGAEEVAYVEGIDDSGELSRLRLLPLGAPARNPAFDVTPARYISGIICEKGIIAADRKSIAELRDAL